MEETGSTDQMTAGVLSKKNESTRNIRQMSFRNRTIKFQIIFIYQQTPNSQTLIAYGQPRKSLNLFNSDDFSGGNPQSSSSRCPSHHLCAVLLIRLSFVRFHFDFCSLISFFLPRQTQTNRTAEEADPVHRHRLAAVCERAGREYDEEDEKLEIKHHN